MALEPDFALSALAGDGALMVTAGPPSVAIFIAAMLAPGESDVPAGSGDVVVAARGAAGSVAGNKISSGAVVFVVGVFVSTVLASATVVSSIVVSAILVSAILVSAAGAGGSAGADDASLCGESSTAAVSGFTASGGGESSGPGGAVRSGSTGAKASAADGASLAGALSGVFSVTGVSMRSNASTGRVVSTGCANTVSGAARHVGVLANSSWAARSKAAAPSPNTRSDIDNTMAANKKRKPGSMDAGSAFERYLE